MDFNAENSKTFIPQTSDLSHVALAQKNRYVAQKLHPINCIRPLTETEIQPSSYRLRGKYAADKKAIITVNRGSRRIVNFMGGRPLEIPTILVRQEQQRRGQEIRTKFLIDCGDARTNRRDKKFIIAACSNLPKIKGVRGTLSPRKFFEAPFVCFTR